MQRPRIRQARLKTTPVNLDNMRAFLGTATSTELLSLHGLGEVTLVSQQSAFSPEELAQVETRTLTLRVDVWEKSWKVNYDLVESIREMIVENAHGVVNLKLTEDDHTFFETDGGEVAVAGGEILNRLVTVISNSLPEDPNAWGTYHQAIELVFKYEVTDIKSSTSEHLVLKFTKSDGGTQRTLGNVLTWKQDYRATRYSELRDERSRAPGSVQATGEFLADTTESISDRRLALLAALQSFQLEIDSKSGLLEYSKSGLAFFSKTVRIEAFEAEINQAVTKIKWSLSAGYTQFPNEAGYAGADFTVATSNDIESGDKVLSFSGSVASNSLIEANAKLGQLRTATLAANSFLLNQQIKSDITTKNISSNDTNPANISTFIEISFSETYRARMSGVESYTLNVADTEDAAAGVITRTYSGNVVASGATADAAFAAGSAKASLLGDNRYPFRVSASITRADRRVNAVQQNVQENLRVEFSFSYKLKGSRVLIDVSADTSADTFGDTVESVSGSVVAASEALARAAYLAQVRNAYNGRLIRSEKTAFSTQKIQTGSFSSSANGPGIFTSSGAFSPMHVKFDFSFSAFKPKDTGFFSLRYSYSVEKDYVALTKSVSISGTMFGTEALLTAAMNETAGNKLDAFLSVLIPAGGSNTKRKRDYSSERVGDPGGPTAITSLNFSETYELALSVSSQVIQCELSEEITYSGTRWVAGSIPDGPSVMMNCGTEPGTRTVSGSVSASTETAAMVWVQTAKALAFPSGTGGGSAPANRYLQPAKLTRAFEFIPLLSGAGRGNFKVCKVSFTFAETLPLFNYS